MCTCAGVTSACQQPASCMCVRARVRGSHAHPGACSQVPASIPGLHEGWCGAQEGRAVRKRDCGGHGRFWQKRHGLGVLRQSWSAEHGRRYLPRGQSIRAVGCMCVCRGICRGSRTGVQLRGIGRWRTAVERDLLPYLCRNILRRDKLAG